ncbi:hypothetical protein ACGC1H_005428 [Rhizoctonia solani]
MTNDNMPASTTTLTRQPGVTGARPDKDQPALPPDAAQAPTQRSSTPKSGTRTQRPTQKTPSKSATMDQPMPPVNAPRQSAQPSAPPGLSDFQTPSAPTAPARLSPLEDRETIGKPNALIEELQGKIAGLETTVQQQKAAIIKCHEDLYYYQEKSKHLESDVYRQEVVSIRRHLQVDEPCEPWEITKMFSDIVRRVEDISRDMGEALGSLTPIAQPTTLSLLKQLLGDSKESLAAASPTADLDLEDFIDFGCRALINRALYTSILGPSVFHPGLKPEENERFCDMYYHIRKQEPQVVAGQWRISTLKLHANRTYSSKDEALHLCEHILLPFCGSVVEFASCIEPIRSILSRVEDLFELALKWNRLVKNSFIMLDFHPQYQPPGSLYDNKYTALEGRKPKPPASKSILLTSKLGLWSSNAVGGRNDPEYSIQIKATMLAAEYFA